MYFSIGLNNKVPKDGDIFILFLLFLQVYVPTCSSYTGTQRYGVWPNANIIYNNLHFMRYIKEREWVGTEMVGIIADFNESKAFIKVDRQYLVAVFTTVAFGLLFRG